MAIATWNVKEALDDVMTKIVEGSTLHIPQQILKDLRARYEGAFTVMHNAGADWPSDRNTILPLARLGGVWASAMTMLTSQGIPSAVDAPSAQRAANLIAGICHLGETGDLFGGYCPPSEPAGVTGSAADDLALTRHFFKVLSLLKMLPPSILH